MKRNLSKVLSVVLLVCLCLGLGEVFAESTGKALKVEEVYALTNPEKYQLKDNEYQGAGWKGIEGHRYGIGLTGEVGRLTFKSSKKSIAAVNSTGTITCKKSGITFITVTDKTSGDSFKFRMRVLKNRKDYQPEYWYDWDDEIGPGVYTYAKSIYLKGSTLYAELFIVNMTDHQVRGDLGPQKLYMYRHWGDDFNQSIDDYELMGTFRLKPVNLKSDSATTVKIKVGKVDRQSIYLRNADAFLRGGIVLGDMDLLS